MNDSVADASAVLALMFNERGADVIQKAFATGRVLMSAVNEAEVLTKLVDLGYGSTEAVEQFSQLGVVSVPFDAASAQEVAALRTPTRPLGLSLGDRACLGLAARLGVPVLTSDGAWARVSLPIEVMLIR